MVKFLKQVLATQLDVDLMSDKCGFLIEQLMELAGLSVAQAISKEYSPKQNQNILICVGPGNNGGDGLVTARHLVHFGYKPKLYYPKQPNKPLYQSLLKQCSTLEIPVIQNFDHGLEGIDLVVDAMLGFGFKPPIREPFGSVLKTLAKSGKPIVSVDVPSGWSVDDGPMDEHCVAPDMLVSLSAPKPCAGFFKGRFHYLGGRFIPRFLAEEYGLEIPEYPGSDQCVLIKSLI
ncbi:hypothetical protein BB560_000379 [Smittium megazygosporum]|uniref:NAD(P)H-hydrate epimerase n=1 Tax=Smittium megazygosporum TaxID=133381 RepID=A0A2T9ZKM1_9FUNG|nr:hypothetical protein BB560_000379 [Smittium megazygosporum]